MLDKDPARRFQTAAEVSRALVEALPTAARNRVQPSRHRMLSLALKWLVGLGMAGCLAGIAFVAGAVVVFWYVLSGPAWVRSGAAVPDSLTRAFSARGLVLPGDTVQLAFRPGDRGDSILFVVSPHRVAVLTPGHARAYTRDSIAYTFDLNWKGGPSASYTLILQGGRRDTVYPDMTLRGAWALARPVALLLPEDSVPGRKAPRVRVSP
jgi:hypothetical protein